MFSHAQHGVVNNENQWRSTRHWPSNHIERDERPNMAKPYIPYDGVVITRADALASGLTRFFTGKPCKHGHLSERTSVNGGCIACNAITAVSLYHAETPEQRAERNERTKAWKDAHRDQVRAEGRAYSQAHREQANAWKAANRDKLNAAERESRLRDPETHKARTARYLATDKAKAVRQAYYVANVETIKRRVKDWTEQIQTASLRTAKDITRPTRKRSLPEWRNGTRRTRMVRERAVATTAPSSTPPKAVIRGRKSRRSTLPRKASALTAVSR